MNAATAHFQHYAQLRRTASVICLRPAERAASPKAPSWLHRLTDRLVRWGEAWPTHRAGAFDSVGFEQRLQEAGARYRVERLSPVVLRQHRRA